MDTYHRSRVAHKFSADLRDVYQAVFLDAHIHETAEVGDVRHDAGEHHTFLQVIDGLHVLVELEYMDGLSGVASGLLQLGHNVGQGRESHLVGHVLLDVYLVS